MIDGYKELTPVIYGENAIKYLYTEQKKAEGEICFLLHWHDRMELTYVTEGTLRFVTEGEEFLVSAGELAVAGPGQMHGGSCSVGKGLLSYGHVRCGAVL